MTPVATPDRSLTLKPVARASAWVMLGLAGGLLLSQPARAQSQPQGAAGSNADVARELKALKDRVEELEKKLDAQQPGMTPDQQQDFNRIAVKTEALEDARDMNGFKGLKISGYVDPTYIRSERQHRAGFQMADAVSNSGYTFDNSYFGVAYIDFVKETDGGPRWHVTLMPQRSSQAVAEGSSSPLHEASASIPLTDLQTRLIAGWMPDWSGYEYLQATLTKTITHNLLFDTTEPTAYTGAGMEITRDKWIVKWMLANLSAAKRQPNEKTPVLAYRVDYAKGEFQGFGFAGVSGKGANPNAYDSNGDRVTNPITGGLYSTDSRLDIFEFDAYFIRGDFTAQGQISWGRQKGAAVSPDPVTGELRTAYWSGLSGLLAWKFDPRLEGVVRLDYIFNKKNGGGLLTYGKPDGINGIGYSMKDADGDGTPDNVNRGVNRGALTLGANYALNLNTVLKCEYRYDWATGEVFANTQDGTYKKSNRLIGASVVVSF